MAARRDVRSVKCLDSSNAIFVKSEKNAGGRLGFAGPNRAMISQLLSSLAFLLPLGNYTTYARSILNSVRQHVPTKCESQTYAHCSMLASACNMTALFFLRPIFRGSMVFLAMASSRGGSSGGAGAFAARCPILLISPVRYAFTACLVRCTLDSGVSSCARTWICRYDAHLECRIRSV